MGRGIFTIPLNWTNEKEKPHCRHSEAFFNWRPQGDSNPRRRRERAVSWARLDDRDLSILKPPQEMFPQSVALKVVSRTGIEPVTI